MDHISFILEWCRNRQHLHFCRRHGRHYHLNHHHFHHGHHSKHHPHGSPHHHHYSHYHYPKPFGQRTVISPASRMNSPREQTVWEDNSPDTLLDICSRFVLANPQTYCCRTDSCSFASTLVESSVSCSMKLRSDSSSFDQDPDGAKGGGLTRDDVDSPMYSIMPSSHMDSSVPGTIGGGASGGPLRENDHTSSSSSSASPSATSSLHASSSSSGPPTFRLLPGLRLPLEICEKLFTMLQEEGLDMEDRTAEIFSDSGASRFRSVNVRGTSITDKGLNYLLSPQLRDLDIHGCVRLTERTLENLNACADRLVRLNIGSSGHILPNYIYSTAELSLDFDYDDADSLDEEDRARTVYDSRGYIIKAPNLARLSINNLEVQRGTNYFDILLKPLPKLTHLDLSGVAHLEGLGDMSFLNHCPHLASLVLHNVLGIQAAINTIREMKNLRHLDISNSDEKLGIFTEPNRTLTTLVESLPLLTSLDISGTNLAGKGVFDATKDCDDETLRACDIPGLVSRVSNPLEFLGLYKSWYEACCRRQIPALRVAGDSNEAQILVSGRQYLDRPNVLENVLNDLFHIFRYQNCDNVKAALDIILLAMDRHPTVKVIQISGSASLYYIVKSEIRSMINVKVKRKILSILLNGMFAHKTDAVMMRNGCLTLCQFSIPEDVIFEYKRLVSILLHIVSEHTSDVNSFIQRAGIFLLNSFACHVDGQQKLLVGDLGAMEAMLALIKDRVEKNNCDDVMTTAWSCMWNVTDETPHNCKRFLDGGGMFLFLKCKEVFPSNQDLLRNMMGLLGNVAEVPHLRSNLTTKEFVEEFTQLLDSNSDGIEVSYNAAGVLAHMASDGPETWTIREPSRDYVLAKMVSAIERWDLNTKRNINYRSFEPILRLVRVNHTPQCQHWAVWALANLTRVDSRYCQLVEQEGGLTLLDEIINRNLVGGGPDRQLQPPSPPAYPKVIELAYIVRENVNRWKEQARGDGLHQAGQQGAANADEELEFDG